MKPIITTKGLGVPPKEVTDTRSLHFDEQHALQELRHYLPSQTPLKDFIHHNSMHALQHMKFYDAIFRASRIFGFQVTMDVSVWQLESE